MPRFRVQTTESVERWAVVEAADEDAALVRFANLPTEEIHEVEVEDVTVERDGDGGDA